MLEDIMLLVTFVFIGGVFCYLFWKNDKPTLQDKEK